MVISFTCVHIVSLRHTTSCPELAVQSTELITTVNSCFVTNSEIIHISKREGAVVF